MFGTGFIIRVFVALLSIAAAVTLVAAATLGASWLFRRVWDALERNYEESTSWFIRKFSLFRPFKPLIMFLVIMTIPACAIITVLFIYFSGISATGQVIP